MKKLLFPLCLFGIFLFGTQSFVDDGSGFAMAQMQMNQLKEQSKASEEKMCGETHVSFRGAQGPRDDEFLYSTAEAYNSVKNRPDGGTVSGGVVYECDNDHCQGGKLQSMAAGHVFEGMVINKAVKYQCKTGLADRWVVVAEGCLYRDDVLPENSWYIINGEKAKLTRAECLQFDLSIDQGINEFYAKCENVSGELKLRCYPVNQPEKDSVEQETPEKEPEKEPENSTNPTQSCVQSRCGGLSGEDYSQCITCCYVPSSVAVWDSSAKICKCADSTKDFNPANLQCEAKVVATEPVAQNNAPKYECDANKLQILTQWSVQFATNTTVVSQINQILVYCGAAPSEIVFNNMFNQVQAMINQSAADAAAAQAEAAAAAELKITQNRARSNISSAISKMDDIRSGLKLTVWRDDEGNFNTSRLLSDSIAGVVLGTAGGLITSNVVKKNQVENGFEDIQCTVGGQVVAGWGDEFRVGIQ